MINRWAIRENTLTNDAIYLLGIEGSAQDAVLIQRSLAGFCTPIDAKMPPFSYVFELANITDDDMLEKIRIRIEQCVNQSHSQGSDVGIAEQGVKKQIDLEAVQAATALNTSGKISFQRVSRATANPETVIIPPTEILSFGETNIEEDADAILLKLEDEEPVSVQNESLSLAKGDVSFRKDFSSIVQEKIELDNDLDIGDGTFINLNVGAVKKLKETTQTNQPSDLSELIRTDHMPTVAPMHNTKTTEAPPIPQPVAALKAQGDSKEKTNSFFGRLFRKFGHPDKTQVAAVQDIAPAAKAAPAKKATQNPIKSINAAPMPFREPTSIEQRPFFADFEEQSAGETAPVQQPKPEQPKPAVSAQSDNKALNTGYANEKFSSSDIFAAGDPSDELMSKVQVDDIFAAETICDFYANNDLQAYGVDTATDEIADILKESKPQGLADTDMFEPPNLLGPSAAAPKKQETTVKTINTNEKVIIKKTAKATQDVPAVQPEHPAPSIVGEAPTQQVFTAQPVPQPVLEEQPQDLHLQEVAEVSVKVPQFATQQPVGGVPKPQKTIIMPPQAKIIKPAAVVHVKPALVPQVVVAVPQARAMPKPIVEMDVSAHSVVPGQNSPSAKPPQTLVKPIAIAVPIVPKIQGALPKGPDRVLKKEDQSAIKQNINNKPSANNTPIKGDTKMVEEFEIQNIAAKKRLAEAHSQEAIATPAIPATPLTPAAPRVPAPAFRHHPTAPIMQGGVPIAPPVHTAVPQAPANTQAVAQERPLAHIPARPAIPAPQLQPVIPQGPRPVQPAPRPATAAMPIGDKTATIDYTIQIESGKIYKKSNWPIEMPLIPTYTFESMDMSSNRFVHATAMSILDNLGTLNNPFLLYGEGGTGKTHFLNALGYEISKKVGQDKILFTNGVRLARGIQRYVEEQKTDKLEAFLNATEVLIIDDIHLTAVNELNREFISRLLNSFYREKKQIIMASKYSPEGLARFEELVQFKLAQGWCSELKPPKPQNFTRIYSKMVDDAELEITEVQSHSLFGADGSTLGTVARNIRRAKVLHRMIEESGSTPKTYEEILTNMLAVSGEDESSQIIIRNIEDITTIQRGDNKDWGSFGFFFPQESTDKFKWLASSIMQRAKELDIKGGFDFALKSAYSTQNVISSAFKIANICDNKNLKGAIVLGPNLIKCPPAIRENFYDILTHMLEVMNMRCGIVDPEFIKHPSAYTKLLGDVLK